MSLNYSRMFNLPSSFLFGPYVSLFSVAVHSCSYPSQTCIRGTNKRLHVGDMSIIWIALVYPFVQVCDYRDMDELRH